MTRCLSAFLGSLAMLGWAGSTQAASVPPALIAEGAPIVEKVHGTHRTCRYSAAMDWWHRHVGPYNRAVSCGPYGYRDGYVPFFYAPFPFLFYEPYGFRERRVVPRYRDGRRFDRRRIERFPSRDGASRRR